MLCKLVGSGMEEKLSMCVFMHSPCREYRSRESLAEVVIEVLGICILHLAKLQCGRRRNDIHVGVRAKSEICFVREKGKSTFFLIY
jgi:hypothetical protein